jgi:ubiquinone/menaquinone biosynthesis C-methylase UbiE
MTPHAGQEAAMQIVSVDVVELETKVKQMYRAVAEHPHGTYHFEMGRGLAERLGYPSEVLDQVPRGAVESFAGVGYHFDLAAIVADEYVVDLGSGSGMDVFVAALAVGAGGTVVGVDMTPEQLAKSETLRRDGGFEQVSFADAHIEDLPLEDASADVVVSNGVINLVADKPAVFREAARILRPGGRLALSDIVTTVPLADSIVCDSDLWAACIGGAAQQDDYQRAIESAGLQIELMKANPYEFLSGSARGASQTYGVRSISLLARRVA